MGGSDALIKPVAGLFGVEQPGTGELAQKYYGPKTQKETDTGLEEFDPVTGQTTVLKTKQQKYASEDVTEFSKNLQYSSGWNQEQISGLTKKIFEGGELGVPKDLEKAFTDWLEIREKSKQETSDFMAAAAKIPGRKSVLGAGGTVLG